MRFYAFNATDTTIHIRLDRDASDGITLTVSKRKREDARRPLSAYVLAAHVLMGKRPRHIAYLDDGKVFTLMNPEKLIIEIFIDSDKDQILKVAGFLH